MAGKVTINVSLNGKHFFQAKVNGEIHVTKKVQTAIDAIKARFPESEGFKVSAMKWSCVGTEVKV